LEDDEKCFEFEIKNLDTNEVFKMQFPADQNNSASEDLQINKMNMSKSKITLDVNADRMLSMAQ